MALATIHDDSCNTVEEIEDSLKALTDLHDQLPTGWHVGDLTAIKPQGEVQFWQFCS